MLTAFKTILNGAMIMAMLLNGAYGQNEADECRKTPQKDNTGDFIHYFLNRDNVPGSLGYEMGELFFAIKQSDKHVQLGKYNGDCWIRIIEVDKKYLIEGLRPLTVGQAAEKFPPLLKEPGVKPGSTLWLRARQKPEYYKTKPLTAPDPKKAAKKEGLAYRWRHIYAIDSVGGQLWYLVGNQSRLFHAPRKDTNASQQVLLGWVPAKANQILATNIALELNTSKAAVDERIYHNKPVIIYEAPNTNSKVLAKENLEMWNDYKNGKKTAGTMAWIEPDGLAPSYPRFYTHGFNPNTGWYHVSIWGGVEEQAAMGIAAFVEGYIPLKDQGRQHPSVQEVVVLEKNDLRTLRENVDNMGTQIENTFQPSAFRGGILGAIMQKSGSSNRRERIAIALLYTILATVGDTATLNYLADLKPDELLSLVKDWLQENANNNIASLMNMQTSIETNSTGLLNLPLKQIVEMDDNTIRAQARLLLEKSHCMKKILNDRTIPLKVSECRSYKGIRKGWQDEQGNENYIYVPMRVIP